MPKIRKKEEEEEKTKPDDRHDLLAPHPYDPLVGQQALDSSATFAHLQHR